MLTQVIEGLRVVAADITGLRSAMEQEFKTVKTDLAGVKTELAGVKAELADVVDRLETVEIRLDELHLVYVQQEKEIRRMKHRKA